MSHKFLGEWISNDEFSNEKPINVFHRQLEEFDLPCDEHRDRHILFRKKFNIENDVKNARIYISADDCYKLYINGKFVGQGPAPAYHFRYNYNVIDVSDFLVRGENTVAVHTLYQGLINRVWQSGDMRHGMILDLEADGNVILSSDETFKTKNHSAYKEIGVVGYDTQFLEEYNSQSTDIGFEEPSFDDSLWEFSKKRKYTDWILTEQKSKMLVFEKKLPISQKRDGNVLKFDFGSNYVGCLYIKVKNGKKGKITVRCGQELNEDGSVRYDMRANCKYEEGWILSESESIYDSFDYKAFRYAELIVPDSVTEVDEIYINARHYPFELKADMKEDYRNDKNLRKIWELCVHTQKYGVQEVIQDCMDREKGFYMGDGCYSAFTNMILTKDDSMVRKLIDDGLSSAFITDSLVTCLNCSKMQEIAEYPLMMIYLILWHYRFTGDKEYLKENYPKIVRVMESYRQEYEKDGLLQNLGKWCIVEWPDNFRDGYDVDLQEGKICKQAHVSINAYYIEAVKTVNKISDILGIPSYRDEKELTDAFIKAFYDENRCIFRDGTDTEHTSLVGNVFPFAFELCPSDECYEKIENMIMKRKLSSLSFFCTFPALMGFIRRGKNEAVKELMTDEKAWLGMISEGATTTFEGWGKDAKWNTSLFHLTYSYGAAFLADVDLKKIFE